MRLETDRIMEVVNADPLTAAEIVNILYPDLDSGSKGTRKGNIHKALNQMVDDGKIEKLMLSGPGNRKVATYVAKFPDFSINDVLDVLSEKPIGAAEIARLVCGNQSYDNVCRIYKVLMSLETGGKVERFPIKFDEGYGIGWKVIS